LGASAREERERGPDPAARLSRLPRFLDRYYQPIDQAPMSAVRDDCRRALDASDGRVWDNWHQAVKDGESEDIAFRLESDWLERILDYAERVEFLLRKVWRLTRGARREQRQ
jgi:hypothetical protein